MPDITIMQGDTLPVVRVICQNSEGVAVDNADASVEFIWRLIHDEDFETLTATNEQGVDINDAITAKGVVSCEWPTPLAGGYEAWFQVSYSGGAVLTFPNGPNPIAIAVFANPNPVAS